MAKPITKKKKTAPRSTAGKAKKPVTKKPVKKTAPKKAAPKKKSVKNFVDIVFMKEISGKRIMMVPKTMIIKKQAEIKPSSVITVRTETEGSFGNELVENGAELLRG